MPKMIDCSARLRILHKKSNMPAHFFFLLKNTKSTFLASACFLHNFAYFLLFYDGCGVDVENYKENKTNSSRKLKEILTNNFTQDEKTFLNAMKIRQLTNQSPQLSLTSLFSTPSISSFVGL